jgi:hypothetical protein
LTNIEIQENSVYTPISHQATAVMHAHSSLYVTHSNQGETTRIRFDLFVRLREEVGRLGKPEGPGPGTIRNAQHRDSREV